MTKEPGEIFANYNPKRAREGLRKSAGTLVGVDRRALLADIHAARKQAIKPIAPFETIEEEAEFWDSHSAVDEIDEGTMVGFHRAGRSRRKERPSG